VRAALQGHYNTEQASLRRLHGIKRDAAGLLESWSELIRECEEGYQWDVSEYQNEMRARDELEVIASADALQHFDEHQLFLQVLHGIDGRFRALVHASWRFPLGKSWWRRAVPSKAGVDFARFCQSAYGFDLDVVT